MEIIFTCKKCERRYVRNKSDDFYDFCNVECECGNKEHFEVHYKRKGVKKKFKKKLYS